MKDGFIKVATATPEIRVADCEYNQNQILNIIKKASDEKVKLLCLPEMCITGYTCGDLFLHQVLQKGALNSMKFLMSNTADLDIIYTLGLPIEFKNRLYNCCAVIYKGEVLGIVPKISIPNYGEFYEGRYFESGTFENTTFNFNGKDVPFGSKLVFSCKNLKEFTFAVEICEDLWVPNPISVNHCQNGAMIILNPSASDELVGKADYRQSLVSGQSARLVCTYLYADAGEGESTTDMVFAGHNLICENGSILSESKLFNNGLQITETDVKKLFDYRCKVNTYNSKMDSDYQNIIFDMPINETIFTRKFSQNTFVPDDLTARNRSCDSILEMQSRGLAKRFKHSFAKTLVVGISGGLDSCLALLVCARTMDILNMSRENIIAVTMPCFGTTKRTKSNAEILTNSLGATLKCVDITNAVNVHFNDIGHDPSDHSVTFENCQARERTQVLMDMANMTSGFVVGTGDLSELALGWATYNGDHMSMYGVNGSVPKTLIRHIVKYVADTSKDVKITEVLYDILDTPVSPELLPATNGEISQKTEDLVGPYELHDFFIYYFLRLSFSPSKIYRIACHAYKDDYDKETILKWLKIFVRRFFNQQFKRSCLPDGPKVGTVTLSPRGDWRMPSDAMSSLWLEELENL